MNWRDWAACTAEDPELFFPVGSGRPYGEQAAEAKRVCHRCPVIDECLEWALAVGEEGIWGGLDDEERRRLRRRAAVRHLGVAATAAEPSQNRCAHPRMRHA
jgi:WhiB family redox-sensing transcriptional regulator